MSEKMRAPLERGAQHINILNNDVSIFNTFDDVLMRD